MKKVLVSETISKSWHKWAAGRAPAAHHAEGEKNSTLGVGKAPGLYVVKTVMPIKDLDKSEIILAIEMTTVFADGFEKALGLGDDL